MNIVHTEITAVQLPAYNLGIMIIPVHITDWQITFIIADIHSSLIGKQCFTMVQFYCLISECYFTISAA